MSVKYTRELLTATAAESTRVNDMMRRLGVPLTGGTHSYLSRRLKHYGIDTSHFSGRSRVGGELPKDELHEAVARTPA